MTSPFSSRVLAWCRCCLMVLARSRWFVLVQDSCVCFCIVVVSFIWLLMVFFGVGCIFPVPDGRGRFRPDIWSVFSSAGLS